MLRLLQIFSFLTIVSIFNLGLSQGEAITNTLKKIESTSNINPDQALLTLDSLIKNSTNISPLNKIKINQLKAICYYYKSDIKKTRYYFNLALVGGKELEDSIIISKLYNNIGATFRLTGNLDVALTFYDSSLVIKQLLHDTLKLGTVYMNIANIYSQEGYYLTATKYYYRSLAIFQKLKIKKNIATALLNIGVCQQNQKLLISADSSFSKALGLFVQLDDEIGIKTVLNNIGTLQMDLAQKTLAKKTFTELIQKAKISNDSSTLAFAYLNLGSLAMGDLNWTRAKSYLRNATIIFSHQGLKNEFLEAKIYDELASFNLDQKTSHFAVVDSCLKEIVKGKSLPRALKVGNYYLDYLEKEKNYKKAFVLIKDLRKIQNQIYNERQITQAKDIEASYKFKRQKEALVRIKNQQKLLQTEKDLQSFRFNVYIIVSVLGLIILLVILLLVLNKNKNKRQILQLQIKNKNAELTRFAMHISEKKEFLLSLKKAFKAVKSPEELRPIYFRIAQNLQSDKESILFQAEVDDFLSNFRFKLEQQKGLSKKDIRLCTLIHLGLSSKEIAIIFNITTKGVEMQRYRLRKKINISSEISIEDWLDNL